MAKTQSKDYFKALQKYCLNKPNAKEDHPWGDTVYKINGNVFAFTGGSGSSGITVKAIPEELERLLKFPMIQLARYVGRFGWISVTIDNIDTLELVYELIDKSYQIIAAKTKKRDPNASAAIRNKSSKKSPATKKRTTAKKTTKTRPPKATRMKKKIR